MSARTSKAMYEIGNNNCNNYEVDINIYTFDSNTTFKGEFKVYWVKNKRIVGVQRIIGFLKIRDVNRNIRSTNEILRVRNYEYVVGDMK